MKLLYIENIKSILMEILYIENIKYILTDLWNFHLVNIGIFIAIFTVLYAFIVSKKNELKAISETIKSGKAAPETYQKEKFAINYIDGLKTINGKCRVICIISFVLGVVCWVSARILVVFYNVWILTIILCVATFGLLIYSLFIFYKIYRNYKKQT